MPQMSPIYWFVLMLYFISLMMILIMLIFFFYMNLPSKKLMSVTDINSINWMW